jgi:transposase
MRGDDQQQSDLYSYVSPEQRVPADHPLRPLRKRVDLIFRRLSPRFDAMYAERGRPSIAPEKLLRALLLQCLYSVRSERLLMEELDYNLLFRWFVGLNMDDPVWDPTVFSKNRERMMEADVARAFFEEVGQLARREGLMSNEHFTVDGTLIEAWASQKSFKPKAEAKQPPSDPDPGNPSVNFRGEQRRNGTHQSSTDPEARLYRKGMGQEAKLAFQGHVLMENRNGLVVETRLTPATGKAEREAAVEMVEAQAGGSHPTVGGDKAYDTRELVAAVRGLGATPHVAQNTARRGGSAIDERTTRHPGYTTSQTKRKRVEEIFGWLKTVALQRKTRFRGVERVGWSFTLAAAAYNLLRIGNLTAEAA